MTALLRARRVLASLGIDNCRRAERAPSLLNEVWLLDDTVLRLGRPQGRRLHYERAVAAVLPPEVGYPEILGIGDADFGEWLLVRRIPGEPLSEAWYRLTHPERRGAIYQLAHAMRLIHATPAPAVRPPFAGDPLGCPHPVDPPSLLLRLVAQARRLPHVDPAVLDGARALVERSAGALDTERPVTLVHGDLHLENVIWGEGRVRAVVDFEFARAGPADLDLDILLRFCAAPDLHVAEGSEGRIEADDFRLVPVWLREAYPELFAHPRLRERLTLYALAYDVRALLLEPPTSPPASLPPHHPYHRVRRTVEGRTPFRLTDL